MEKSVKYSETVQIPAAKYIYRVVHRIMEGDCEFDHGPREVDIKELIIGKYPVTNNMFKEFLDETGFTPEDDHNFLKHWENGSYTKGQDNTPVVWVSQNDARAYTSWTGCRLPRDYEWQYAAGGNEKLVYPFGNKLIKTKCNCDGMKLTPVDYYPQGASPFGLMDMCGNAHEWMDDLIDDGMHRFTFLRGGCYFQAPNFWHTDGGARPTSHHLKFQLLSEGQNRCGTTTFRCVREA
jgi:formylglycine-generating enzyme required for sulfatase activity